MDEEENTGWVAGSLQEVTETLFDLMRANPFYLNTETEPYSEPGIGLITPQVDQGWLHIQNILNPFVLFLATLGILLAAVRLLWQRRLDPMMDLIRGLLTVIVTTFAGIFIVTVLVALSRALTDMVLHFNLDPDSVEKDLLDRAAEVYPSVLRTAMNEEAESVGFAGPAAQGAITEMVGLAVVVGLTVQVVVLALLQAIVYLLVCVLPLAAASTMVPNLQIFTKLIGWLLACLLYKPLIMLLYLAGLVLLGINTGDNALFRYLLAAAIMLLATGALPVLMKLMSSPGVWALALGSTLLGGGGGNGSGAAAGGGASGEGASGDASGSTTQNASTGGSLSGSGSGDGSGAGAEAANDRADNVEAGLGNADFGSGAAVQAAGLAGAGGAADAVGGADTALGGSAGGPLAGASGAAGGGSAVTAAAGGAGGLESDGAVAPSSESAVASEVSSTESGDAATGAADTGSAGAPGSSVAESASDAAVDGAPGAESVGPGAVPTASHDAPAGATEA